MPVPTSGLVVKKGSKMRGKVFGRDAAPLSRTEMERGVVAKDFDFDDAAGLGQGVAGVGDDVGEDLAEIVGGKGKGEFGVQRTRISAPRAVHLG